MCSLRCDISRVFIWHCLLIFFPSNWSPEHVTSRVRGAEFRIKWKKPNPNLNLTLNSDYILLFLIITFVSLSWFLLLISGLCLMRRYWGDNVSQTLCITYCINKFFFWPNKVKNCFLELFCRFYNSYFIA